MSDFTATVSITPSVAPKVGATYFYVFTSAAPGTITPSVVLTEAATYFYVLSFAAAVLPVGVAAISYGAAPTTSNQSPADGTTISAGTPVQFDVLDDTGIAFVAVFVRQGLAYDVVHDGVNASPRYGVTIAPISGGYRYVVQAVGGWSAPPTFVVRALDRGGQLG